MSDLDKNREQLIKELEELRQQNARLQQSQSGMTVPEEDRHDRKNMYRLISENTSDLVSFTSFSYDLIYTYTNLSHKQILGYTPEYLIGKSGLDFIHPDDKKKFLPLLEDYLSKKAELPVGKEYKVSQHIQFRFKDASERWHYLESTVNIVGDELLFISKDITERQGVDKKLREARDYLDNIIISSLDSIIVTDNTGYIARVNPSFLHLLGYREEEVIGKHMIECGPMEEGYYDSITGERIHINKKYFDSMKKSMHKFLKDGKVTNRETFYLTKDKKVVSVEDSLVFLTNENGEQIGAVGIARDITDRKRAEERLKKSEEKYQSLIEHANDAIISINKEGILVGFNKKAEEMFGYSSNEILGKPSYLLAPVGTRENQKQIVKQFEETGIFNIDKKILEGPGLKKNGQEFPSELSFYVLELNGEPIVTAIVRDITERKQAERALKKAYDELEERVEERTANLKVVNEHLKREIAERKRAERELKEAKDFLENVFKTSVDGIIITDFQGTILLANEAVEKMMGYSQEELIGKFVAEFSPQDKRYREEGAKMIAQLMEEGVVAGVERLWLKKDGSLVNIEVNMSLLKDKDGVIAGVVGSVRDITERKRSEIEIREAKDYLENIFKTSGDAIMVTDYQGTIMMVNTAMENLSGYSRDELLGMHSVELAPRGKEYERGKEFAYKLFEEGVLDRFEHTWIKKDGSAVDIEINASLLIDKGGSATGAVGSVRDITERRRAEREIKETRDFLDNVVSNTVDGMILTDSQGTITRVNEAVEKMLGYTQEELQEMHISQLGNFDDTFRLWLRKDMVGKLFQDGRYKEFEALWKRKDGELILLESNAALLKNREGNVIGGVISARDISERKKLQEIEMKNAFMANISHEFRTPLTLSIGPLEGLLRGEYGYIGTEAKDQIGLALRNNRRQLKLINHLLEFARLGSRGDAVNYHKKDINLFVSALVDSFTFLATKKDINLAFIPDEAIEPVYIDPGKLERVLLNIIGNAFKFTPRGGNITITTKNGKENVGENLMQISVNDTGIGIKEEDLPHIYERFQQVGSHSSRSNQGSGIGLSLAKELIVLQKGKIETESTYGKGSTFTVYLPRGKDHVGDLDQINDENDEIMLSEKEIELADLGYEEEEMLGEKPTGTRPLILFIDDNPDLRRYVTSILVKDYEVITAEDGLDGLEKLKDYIPDVIISDIMMPRMDGYELCKAVKSNKSFRHIPFIFLTAKADTAFKIESLQEGADDYIVKPFNSQELQARVRSLLRIQSLLRENILQEKKIAVLREALGERHHYHNLIGKSSAMQECYRFLEKIKDSESPVLIFGETGTGKELVAHAIQSNSKRRDNPFIILNCTAINRNLLESELFGHIKGAFTGAIADKKGIFEVADGGTLFLDEIAEMSLSTQVKLLRVLEEGTFRSAGSTVEKKVNVRIIAATNKNLKEMTTKGRFREDLYYRINVITVDLPPLRERKEDIPLLVDYFIKESNGKGGEKMVSENALHQLTDYNYPGNVRELRNIIERAVMLCENDLITFKDLPQEVVKGTGEEQEPVYQKKEELTLEEKKEGIERETIVRALKQANGNKAKAAKIINISRSTLYAKIEKYKIEH